MWSNIPESKNIEAIEGPKATKCNDTCSVIANDSDIFCKEKRMKPIKTLKNTLIPLFKLLSVFNKKTADIRSIAIKKNGRASSVKKNNLCLTAEYPEASSRFIKLFSE